MYGRWSAVRVARALHTQLRRGHRAPARTALSVALGTAIGCLPVYGLHLWLCFGSARLLGLSGVLAYLAAHINNPWTAPFLLYLELAVGHWLSSGSWPTLSVAIFRDSSVMEVGGYLFAGSLVVGMALATLLGGMTYELARKRREGSFTCRFSSAAAERFSFASPSVWELSRCKLRYDPVYLSLLRSGMLPREGLLVDLGCGRGLFFAAILAAADLESRGEWPSNWPRPPCGLQLRGIEIRRRDAEIAAAAFENEVEVQVQDVRTAPLPAADAVTLLDTLHYLEAAEQERLVARVVRSLNQGGVLLIREADAAGGLRFRLTAWSEKFRAVMRLEWRRALRYRTATEWAAILRRLGLQVGVLPMSSGTPFANALVFGRKPMDGSTVAVHRSAGE